MKKGRRIIGTVVLAAVVLVSGVIIRKEFFKEDGTIIEAVYLKKEDGNNVFVNLKADYPFTGLIPEGEIYGEGGEKITGDDLNNGDVLKIYGNGIMAESYPAKYPGITKAVRTEKENRKYIEKYGHYLDELFTGTDPSMRPHLNVCYSDELGDVSVMVPEAFSYEWTYKENGENRTITSDKIHVLQTEPTEVKKLSAPLDMELEFDEQPECIQIFSWDDSLLGQYQENTDQIPEGIGQDVIINGKGFPQFTARPGCVYLIRGTWENGTADYGIRVPAE